MEFIGRKEELSRLEELYSKPGPCACAIMGRRRVGKTTLVEKFYEGKPHLHMHVVGGTKEVTMRALSRELSAFLGNDIVLNDPLDLTEELARLDPEKKTVVFIDEFPLLVELFPATPGILQNYIDIPMKKQDIMLIVCGSSIKAMSEELTDSRKPLFGRFSPLMRIRPMPYEEARLFHPTMSEEDRVRMYAIASGMPQYHRILGEETVEGNIKRAFLRMGEMADEAESALSKELPAWRSCRSILTAIASGYRTVSDISEATGLSVVSCETNLENLSSLGFVEPYVPWGRQKPRMYRIVDGIQLLHY